MADQFIISAEAERDVAEAFAWYEERSTGLGDYFLDRLDACFTQIRQRPMMFEVVVEGYRRALLKRFPFAVFFELSDDRILIDAVFHCSQDPEKWRKRLRSDQ
jgi:toxin ParE1/3/4